MAGNLVVVPMNEKLTVGSVSFGPFEDRPVDLPASIQLVDQVQARDAKWRAALAGHWLYQIICNHEAQTDRSCCGCGRFQSTSQPNVGEAAKRWVEHVQEVVDGKWQD